MNKWMAVVLIALLGFGSYGCASEEMEFPEYAAKPVASAAPDFISGIADDPLVIFVADGNPDAATAIKERYPDVKLALDGNGRITSALLSDRLNLAHLPSSTTIRQMEETFGKKGWRISSDVNNTEMDRIMLATALQQDTWNELGELYLLDVGDVLLAYWAENIDAPAQRRVILRKRIQAEADTILLSRLDTELQKPVYKRTPAYGIYQQWPFWGFELLLSTPTGEEEQIMIGYIPAIGDGADMFVNEAYSFFSEEDPPFAVSVFMRTPASLMTDKYGYDLSQFLKIQTLDGKVIVTNQLDGVETVLPIPHMVLSYMEPLSTLYATSQFFEVQLVETEPGAELVPRLRMLYNISGSVDGAGTMANRIDIAALAYQKNELGELVGVGVTPAHATADAVEMQAIAPKDAVLQNDSGKTLKGIGPGSSRADVLNAYGKPSLGLGTDTTWQYLIVDTSEVLYDYFPNGVVSFVFEGDIIARVGYQMFR